MEKELQKRIVSSIIIIPLSLFFILKGSAFFILFLTILFLIASFEWLKMTKKKILNFLEYFFYYYPFIQCI